MPPLPDLRQADNFRCGEIVARTVLDVWKVRARIISVANAVDGTHPATLMAIFRGAGLRCLSGECSLPLLKALTRAGMPVVALIQKGGDGHWVVVGDVRRGKVEYQCPLEGPCKATEAEFDEAWHDVDGWGVQYRRFVIVAFP